MKCKNCNHSLSPDHQYCPNCGAKIIYDRLSVKTLGYEISERFFNVDNTFLKTFWHLFWYPERVIDGYVQGIRKRYLNPISYLGIALTLSGIFLFLLRKFFMDNISFDVFSDGLKPETAEKLMRITLDFSTFLFLLFIPLVAFSGWLIFNRKKYNLTEYAVCGIYTLAHYSVFSFPISVLVCILAPESYSALSIASILMMASYVTYVLNRVHGRRIIRSILFLALFILGLLLLSSLLNVFLLLTGLLTVEDLTPPQN